MRRSAKVSLAAGATTSGRLLLEVRIPGLSEPASAVALGALRSLLRAPEAKMMLLMPLITAPIFGSFAWKSGRWIPLQARPLVAVGVLAMVLFSVLQFMGNQFGFDRDGFRALVLSPAPRRDILLGRNLAFVPLILTLSAILLSIVQIAAPLQADHLLAMIPQSVSMFLMFCILSNLMSITAPICIPAGALKAANPKLSTVLLQLAIFLILFPLTQGLTLLPLALEALARYLGWLPGVSIALILSLAQAAAIVALYRVSLTRMGRLLQSRERRILDTVAGRAP